MLYESIMQTSAFLAGRVSGGGDGLAGVGFAGEGLRYRPREEWQVQTCGLIVSAIIYQILWLRPYGCARRWGPQMDTDETQRGLWPQPKAVNGEWRMVNGFEGRGLTADQRESMLLKRPMRRYGVSVGIRGYWREFLARRTRS